MARADRTALLLIDVVDPTRHDESMFNRLSAALKVARAAGMRVIHVWSAVPGEGPPPTHPEVEPRPGEPVLPNYGSGAWSGAALAETLRMGAIESIVVGGPAESPAWWPTVTEAAGQPLEVQVFSDRRPENDVRTKQLLHRNDGQPGAGLVDVGSWVASNTTGLRPSGREHSRTALGAKRHRGDKRRPVLVPFVAVLLAAAIVGSVVVVRGARKYYEFSPGSAPTVTASNNCKARNSSSSDLSLPDGSPCALLVVPSDRAHTTNGKLFMVDVLVGPASPIDYALEKLHLLNLIHAGNELIPSAAVLGTAPASQLGCQDAQEMTDSTQYAAVAALDRLGFPVKENDLGALVTQVGPGSAADAAGVKCNDVVTALNGQPVHTADALVAGIHALAPGAVASITVTRNGADGKPATVNLTAKLTGTPGEPASGGYAAQPAKPNVAFLGVATQTQFTYSYPFPVSIQVGNIGGPSAGLALTLGLLDVLSNGRLTGGHAVAATGTISPDGTVGDVGGVAQKAIAVRRAGAEVFLVPPQEYAAAKSNAGHMKVLPVTSLQEALTDLQQLGGDLGPLAQKAPKG